MEKDVFVIPMVISMKENTGLVDDMGGVYTPGILEQSTMESLKQISDTERYDFVPFRILCFRCFQKKKKEAHLEDDIFLGVRPSNFLTACHLLFSICFRLTFLSQGLYKWPSGAIYDGQFVNGQQEGKGKYTYSDGGKYTGTWKACRRNGLGYVTRVAAWSVKVLL
jgi:MORN repeat